jgi:hypothetical protein
MVYKKGGIMKISDELPFTTEALLLYIQEAKKRIKYLSQFVSEHNRLKNRIKISTERLKNRTPT